MQPFSKFFRASQSQKHGRTAFTTKIPVLFLGGTGYVGGTFLSRILADPALLSNLDITLYIRSSEKAKYIEDEFPFLKTVIGTTAELHRLEQLAELAHVVVNFVSADDTDMAQALLRGLKKRHRRLNDRPFVLHTTGTGVLVDFSRKMGNFITDDIYSDMDVERLDRIPADALHRPVDLLFLEADKEDPALIRDALVRKRVGIIGEGQAIWDNVHVEDLADLFAIILRRMLSDPASLAHGREGYFFAENGEHLWRELSARVADVLYALGAIDSPELLKFETEDGIGEFAKNEPYVFANGTNARSRAVRARQQLGWTPMRGLNDLWASLKPEAEALIAEMGMRC
ncbi:NAD(P)-binding protein [Epithele typhae]|uniref:NAD(P)-binding protein n=1 Tax=Epithele typhae TaxID=378194 RepID=UPI00200794BB|nr:NAD(P)-binding protein [Epithele typhae]KAH9918381.1 NAD(P)-binding protein [Epithele typhae]